MTPRAIATLIPALFIMAVIQFFSAMAGVTLAIIGAIAIPFLAFGLLRFFEIQVNYIWVLLVPVVASTAAIVLWAMAHPSISWAYGLCPFIAFAITAGVLWYQDRDKRRCGLCDARLSGVIALECPRCGVQVCEQKCWDFEHLRCRLCVQNQVPIFPPDGRWWDQNFGAKTPHGRCQLCQSDGMKAELRNCPHCGRPQCRECWDDANGVCSRCKRIVPPLPDRLRAYMVENVPR